MKKERKIINNPQESNTNPPKQFEEIVIRWKQGYVEKNLDSI